MIVNDHYTTRGALRASQSKVFSLSKQRLDASNIAAIARIDTQDITIVDEHGNLDGRAGFERCGFRAALDRIALEARLCICDLHLNESGSLYGEYASVIGAYLNNFVFLYEL